MRDWIATDLDGTLFCRAWAGPDAVPGTWRHNTGEEREPSSWMPGRMHRLMLALGQAFTLVPVTARDAESFSRVDIQGLNLRGPAVLANGAIVIGWDGQPDAAWDSTVATLLTPWQSNLELLCTRLIELSAGVTQPRLVRAGGGLAAYLVAKAPEHWWESHQGRALVGDIHWVGCRIAILGRELQVLPPGLGKREAVQALEARFFGAPPLMCLGDMPLDLEFMRAGGVLATPAGSPLDASWP